MRSETLLHCCVQSSSPTSRLSPSPPSPGADQTGSPRISAQPQDLTPASLYQHLQRLQLVQAGAAGLQATGLQATGVQASGLQATGIQAAGLQAAGMQASGLQAAGLQAAGIQASGLQAAGIQASGLQAAGLQATGLQASGLQTSPLGVPLVPMQAGPREYWTTDAYTNWGQFQGCRYMEEGYQGREYEDRSGVGYPGCLVDSCESVGEPGGGVSAPQLHIVDQRSSPPNLQSIREDSVDESPYTNWASEGLVAGGGDWGMRGGSGLRIGGCSLGLAGGSAGGEAGGLGVGGSDQTLPPGGGTEMERWAARRLLVPPPRISVTDTHGHVLEALCSQQSLAALCSAQQGSPSCQQSLAALCSAQQGSASCQQSLAALCSAQQGTPGCQQSLAALCSAQQGAPGCQQSLADLCSAQHGSPGCQQGEAHCSAEQYSQILTSSGECLGRAPGMQSFTQGSASAAPAGCQGKAWEGEGGAETQGLPLDLSPAHRACSD